MSNRYADLIGRLPEDWPMKRLSDIADRIEAGGTPSRSVVSYWCGEIPWVTPGELTNLGQKYINGTRESISIQGLNSSTATLLPKNSLLVTTRATLGARALAARPMTTNQGFKSIVFNNTASPDFYYHFLRILLPELVRRSSGTTFLELSGRQFGQITVPVPPLVEQRRVASILDTADQAVQSTERLIAKLKLARQGLLSDLVASEHSTQRRIGEIAKVTVGHVGPTGEFYTDADSGVMFLRTGNITAKGILLMNLRYVSKSFHITNRKSALRANDVVISRVGYTGTAAVVPELGEANCANMIIVRPAKLINPHFLRVLFESELVIKQVSAFTVGSAQPVLNIGMVQQLKIPVPPLASQSAVMKAIDRLDARICMEEAKMEKLAVLKLALMDDLLTARVRVPTGEAALG